MGGNKNINKVKDREEQRKLKNRGFKGKEILEEGIRKKVGENRRKSKRNKQQEELNNIIYYIYNAEHLYWRKKAQIIAEMYEKAIKTEQKKSLIDNIIYIFIELSKITTTHQLNKSAKKTRKIIKQELFKILEDNSLKEFKKDRIKRMFYKISSDLIDRIKIDDSFYWDKWNYDSSPYIDPTKAHRFDVASSKDVNLVFAFINAVILNFKIDKESMVGIACKRNSKLFYSLVEPMLIISKTSINKDFQNFVEHKATKKEIRGYIRILEKIKGYLEDKKHWAAFNMKGYYESDISSLEIKIKRINCNMKEMKDIIKKIN